VIAYVDASIILRLLLKEPNPLREWPAIQQGVTSALAEVEVFRTLDRMRFHTPPIAERVLTARREAAFRILEGLDTIELTRTILSRAAQPLPSALGTLDAIHLVSAMIWHEQSDDRLTLATHDAALGLAARASGFEVVGTPP
jgi:predicted nucleic acid-binding protein